VRSKQSDDPDTAWIVPQALVNRVEPLAGWQGNENSYLRGDGSVGSQRQVMLRPQVDESEQCNGKCRKDAGHQCGPSQPVGSQELGQLHHVVWPKDRRNAPLFCSAWAVAAKP
jgi:hypothetical protein